MLNQRTYNDDRSLTNSSALTLVKRRLTCKNSSCSWGPSSVLPNAFERPQEHKRATFGGERSLR